MVRAVDDEAVLERCFDQAVFQIPMHARQALRQTELQPGTPCVADVVEEADVRCCAARRLEQMSS